ncbi:MAG: DegT/DnrJ/EryC1/StrS family aminotransferase [Bacteroidia bacterium]|nr:DegT/DnrJ/EryC1/StrS family aminotransferase [Bacteroidia bacterium]
MKDTLDRDISMVDLKSQYKRLKPEIDRAIANVINQSSFIKGKALKDFEQELAQYLNVKHAIGVGNGTDALQIALMSLDLSPGDEVIVPAFTYVATAEVIGLLGLKPVMVDVDLNNFNISIHNLEKVITHKTRAIVPVHLYGQSAPMDDIIDFAKKYDLYVIEDNAQSIGGSYFSKTNQTFKTGTMGHIGCTSFFPSKNLGCFGDGGAVFTNNDSLADKIRMIANHGQSKKYIHDRIGVNSRLDSIQAAILRVKLKELDDFSSRRQKVALVYDEELSNTDGIMIPNKEKYTNHVYHQYTMKIIESKRDKLKSYLSDFNIPSMVYYPIPLYKQKAFSSFYDGSGLTNTEVLCNQVLSLPIHTEMESETQNFIISKVKDFFRNE